ncbi:MAG: hypothetical protein QM296_07900 [Bacillota bacterium]|nr:hypothetical protein [Bacillota bacterium]
MQSTLCHELLKVPDRPSGWRCCWRDADRASQKNIEYDDLVKDADMK